GTSIKTDDYALLNTFLNNQTTNGGLYLGGDDFAESLSASADAAAVSFKSNYIPFTPSSGDQISAGLRISANVLPLPRRFYTDDCFVFGGCQGTKDFDVLSASGTSRIEMSYMSASGPFGAVISNQKVNTHGATVTVILSGFSFAAVRDDDLNGISDRAKFLRDTIFYTGAGPIGSVTAAGPSLNNSLAQNYPNPFNPQTTIAFSIATRAATHLAIYDVNGALVRTLANEMRAAGPYRITWDGRDDGGRVVASGVYFYKLSAGGFTQTKKMVLLK